MATILDHRGEPIRKAELTRELAGPTVTGVRSILSEHPAQGLTPGRLAVLLREAETGDAMSYLELAEDMEERHLHYLAVLGTRKRQVAQLDVRVVAADDGAEAERDAALVRDWVDSEPLEDELVDILDALGKGFSVTEIMWDQSERQWMPARLEYRDPRWFEFDDIDGRTLRLRGLDNRLEPLAPFKFVRHVFRAKSGLPIRGGFARMVAWFYLFSVFGLKDWVQFIETYGQPTRIGRYPSNATGEERAVLLRALTNLGADAAAMIPEKMLIELIQGGQGGGGSETAHQALLGYLDALISKAVLGQTLTTEAGERGARSLGEVHDSVRRDIERSDAFALSQTLTRDVARPLVALNHGERRRYPQIVVGREDTLDVARTADALAKLVPLGLRVPESAVRELVGFEAPESADDVLAVRGGAAPGAHSPEMARALARAFGRGRGAGDDFADALAEHLDGDGWRAMMSPIVAPVREAARTSASFDEFRRRLPALFAAMDDTALAEALHRLGFSAALSGAAGLSDDG